MFLTSHSLRTRHLGRFQKCAARQEKKRNTPKTIHGCSEEGHVEVGVTEEDAMNRVTKELNNRSKESLRHSQAEWRKLLMLHRPSFDLTTC